MVYLWIHCRTAKYIIIHIHIHIYIRTQSLFARFSAVLLASGNSPNAFRETIWRRILQRSTYWSLFSLFLKNVFAVCMVYHPPFLGIIFGCVPLDFVNLKNAFPRARSSENGTLDFLRSLSVPFAFF